jgi:fatty-acid peroxygenase
MPLIDQTLSFAIKGYAWLPDLRRRSGGKPVHLRIGGRTAVAIGGPAAAEFFYGQGNMRRHGAVPEPVLATLFGKSAVHTLDGAGHRHRKGLFVALLMERGTDPLVRAAGEAFDEVLDGRRGGPPFSLFDAAATALCSAVADWAGVPVEGDELGALTADLVAMVDGFGSAGPRHVRARVARLRRERLLSDIVEDVRREAPDGSPLSVVANHRTDGSLLPARTAAVEVLNLLRPTTAVAWLVAFAGHAMDRWPACRGPLRAGDEEYTTAFAHEVRRFYPFAPFLGAKAARDLRFQGEDIPRGTTVLLDVYGQHHDPRVWPDPYVFRPERFAGRPVGEFELIPQGGGDPRTGHRCPGEKLTIALLGTLAQRLARSDFYLPPSKAAIDLTRVPALPDGGLRVLTPNRLPAHDRS